MDARTRLIASAVAATVLFVVLGMWYRGASRTPPPRPPLGSIRHPPVTLAPTWRTSRKHNTTFSVNCVLPPLTPATTWRASRKRPLTVAFAFNPLPVDQGGSIMESEWIVHTLLGALDRPIHLVDALAPDYQRTSDTLLVFLFQPPKDFFLPPVTLLPRPLPSPPLPLLPFAAFPMYD